MTAIMKYYALIYICLNLFFAGCSHTEQSASLIGREYEKLAKTKYDGTIEYTASPDKQFVLVVNKEKENSAGLINFFIYDLKQSLIVFEDKISFANVFWKNNSRLEVTIFPEMISTSQNKKGHGYYFDTELMKKIPK